MSDFENFNFTEIFPFWRRKRETNEQTVRGGRGAASCITRSHICVKLSLKTSNFDILRNPYLITEQLELNLSHWTWVVSLYSRRTHDSWVELTTQTHNSRTFRNRQLTTHEFNSRPWVASSGTNYVKVVNFDYVSVIILSESSATIKIRNRISPFTETCSLENRPGFVVRWR
jgi:hypothetical protein